MLEISQGGLGSLCTSDYSLLAHIRVPCETFSRGYLRLANTCFNISTVGWAGRDSGEVDVKLGKGKWVKRMPGKVCQYENGRRKGREKGRVRGNWSSMWKVMKSTNKTRISLTSFMSLMALKVVLINHLEKSHNIFKLLEYYNLRWISVFHFIQN